MSETKKREQEIDAVLASLRRAWTAAPSLRLGQLVENAVVPTVVIGNERGPKLFYLEDQKLARNLEAFYQLAMKANMLAVLRNMESRCLDDKDDVLAVAVGIVDAL
jgi:hypothetical protein